MKKSIISAWLAAELAAATARGAVQLNNLSVYPTIQGAVNAATNGDTLKIGSGLYPELVIVSNKNLTMEGGYNGGFIARDGGDSVVDAQQAGTTLWIMSSSSRVDRVHLRGGAGYPQNLWCGGGSLLHRSWVEFTDCRVYSNTASFGGGLFVGLDAYAKLTGATEVYSNAAVWSGGGAFVDGRCDLVHSNTAVYGNVANEGSGGGIWVETGYLRMFQSRVRGNRALPGGSGATAAGGGVGAAGSFVEMGDGATLWANEAIAGGGLALFDSTGHLGRARIADCYLGANSAVSSGGGLYASNSVLMAKGLYCWGNEALQAGGGAALHSCAVNSDTNGLGADQCRTEGHGGGFYLGNTTVQVTRLTGWMNEAGGHGGGLYATGSWIHASGMDFRYNTALQPLGPPVGGLGGAAALFNSTLTVTNGVDYHDAFTMPWFADNQASTNWGEGGAIYAGGGSTATIHRAMFTNNTAFHGGAIAVESGTLAAYDSILRENAAVQRGGGMYAYDSDLSLWGSDYTAGNGWAMLFRGNEAQEGGAAYFQQCASLVSHSAFIANNSPAYASGLLVFEGTLWMDNSLVAEAALSAGAGLWLSDASTTTVIGCTVTANESTGVRIMNGGTFAALNSILWGNGQDVDAYPAAVADITYSDVGGAGWPGVGNINTNPSFYANFHLRHGSPCINAGGVLGGAYPPAFRDMDGEARANGSYDMGCDEFADTDGDRMPDSVETHTGAYVDETDLGTDPNDPDSDGDSMDDGDEWLADTDPTRGDEYLRIQSIAVSTLAPGGVDVHWVGGTQADQVLEWADRPDGTWQGCAWYSAPTPKNNQGSFALGSPTGLVFRVRAYRP